MQLRNKRNKKKEQQKHYVIQGKYSEYTTNEKVLKKVFVVPCPQQDICDQETGKYKEEIHAYISVLSKGNEIKRMVKQNQ
jgi:hypothetical protein